MIDLTNSSPEPEQRPRPPAQQSRPPTYFKTETQDTSSVAARVKTERKSPVTMARGTSQRPKQVDRTQLELIIDTSSSEALRSVLLTLCEQSPALSGALVRGLAPRSTYAQALTRQHRQKLQAAASRSAQRDESSQDTYERMKQRLKAQQSLRTRSQNRGESHTTAEGSQPRQVASQTTPRSGSHSSIPGSSSHSAQKRPAASQSAPRIKREALNDMGDGDSDSDSFIPDFNSHSAQRPKLSRPSGPAQRSSSDSSSFFRAPTLKPLPQRSARIQESPKIKKERQKCTLCHDIIEDELGTCFSHPSSEVDSQGNLKCCDQPSWQMGCMLGMHVTESEARMKRMTSGA